MNVRPDLDVLGAELQRELRLLDWQVTYLYVADLTTVEGCPVYGLCDRLVDNKTATIAIRDPLASQPLPAGAEEKTVEAALMHELVHLHVAPLAVNTPQGVIAEEQAVWPLAEAMTKWRGTARGETLARAMRAGPQIIGKKESRRMGAMAKALAMVKAAMESDGVKEDSATARVLAALMTDDEKGPDSEKKEPAARAEEALPKKNEDAAPVRPAAVAAMTIGDVDARAVAIARAVVGEHHERSALIERNRAQLGDKLADSLVTEPLATVKRMVAARLLDAPTVPAAGAEQRAARVGVGPLPSVPTDPLSGVPAEDRADTEVALRRMSKVMGLATETSAAIKIDRRGMQLSHLGSLRDQVGDFVKAEQARAARAGG